MVLLMIVLPFFLRKSTPNNRPIIIKSDPKMTRRNSNPSLADPVPANDLSDSPKKRTVNISISFFIEIGFIMMS